MPEVVGPLSWARSWAGESPEDLALVGPGLSLTAGELWDTAQRISRSLADAGVAPGEFVACAGPAAVRPLLTLAALARGAVSVGHLPELPRSRVVAFGPVPGVAEKDLIRIDLQALADAGDPGDQPGLRRAEGEPALVVASSGTTGIPKPVVFTTTQLVERVGAARRTWLPDGPFASLLGPSSMSGQVSFLAALQRRAVHLVPGDAAANLAQVRAHRVRVVKGSPAQLSDLLRAARRAGERLDGLELVQSAGSPLSPALAGELAGWFGAAVRGLYGATETGTVAILDDPAGAEPGDAGMLIAVDEVRTDDGRVHIRTAGMASGYLGGEGFPGGWFAPGDTGSIENGRLRLSGRADDLLNAAGVKVMPQRIEELAIRLPGVTDAAACSAVDERGVRRIALAIVGDGENDPAAIVGALRGELQGATPRIVVRLPAIPRTAAGKIDRPTLAELVQDRLPGRLEFE